ncbi:MAG: hypothetical protein ACLTSZ_08005 [Lachnospiraceae bacterium]
MAKRLDDYRLEIRKRGGESEYLTAEQIKLAFVDDSSINRMLKAQKSFLWPVMILLKRSNAAAVAFSYDRDAAMQAFSELDCMNPLYVTRTGGCLCENDGHRLWVEPEVMGTTLDAEKPSRACRCAGCGAECAQP